jgi:hypothetical protein
VTVVPGGHQRRFQAPIVCWQASEEMWAEFGKGWIEDEDGISMLSDDSLDAGEYTYVIPGK